MPKRTKFSDSAGATLKDYYYYLDLLTELAVSSFHYDGLPETIDERFLELTLFTDGQIVYFNDDIMGLLALQVITSGRLNVYRQPETFRAFAVNGYQRELDQQTGVICYNNNMRTPSFPAVERFARKLATYEQIIWVNANAQKTPVLITGTEQQRLTLKNVYMQWDGNQPAIFGDKNADWNALSTLRTDAPYVADKVTELKYNTWHEALTYLGISNITITKKERMVKDEVYRMMGGVIMNRYMRLKPRQQAVDRVNRMFGTNISVEYQEDYEKAAKAIVDNDLQEDETS